MTKSRLANVTCLLLLGCSQTQNISSYTKEQIDAANSLIHVYGFNAMPTYEELLKFTSVTTRNADGSQRWPWADSYWPTEEKGLARRWSYIVSEDEKNQDRFRDFFMASYFQTEIDALSQQEPSIYLSPSEKFDLVYRAKFGLRLQADNVNLAELRAVEERHSAVDFSRLPDEEAVGSARSLARDYADAFRHSRGSRQNMLMTLAPMTSEGLLNWLDHGADPEYNFPGYEGDAVAWSWEGICHGWAPAAVYSEEPKFAVKVDVPINGAKKPLIFTEGDIRGLLSKTWAEANNPDLFFIGRRCEQNLTSPLSHGPVNEFGRAVTGKLVYVSHGVTKDSQFTIVQDYPRGEGPVNLMRVILENEWTDGKPKYAYLIEKAGFYSSGYKLVFDETQAFDEAERGIPASDTASVRSLQIFGCWDVNPASFHTVLVQNIGKRNLGTIMDRTQSAQVWNQPIGAAEFTIGELKDVAELGDNDVARYYRAPGTKYVAQVRATVHWTSEPVEPRFSYKDSFDFDESLSRSSHYDYTLEFDEQKRLIGGEWGKLGKLKPEQQNPDFLFGLTKIVEPNLNATPYLKRGYEGYLKKIHSCSLKDKADGQMEVEATRGGLKETIAFVNCKLD